MNRHPGAMVGRDEHVAVLAEALESRDAPPEV